MKTEKQISQAKLTKIDEAYRDPLKPVLKKHDAMLKRLDRLMQEGEAAMARQLWRRSGILDDLAQAIAKSGAVSAETIRKSLAQIRKAVSYAEERA